MVRISGSFPSHAKPKADNRVNLRISSPWRASPRKLGVSEALFKLSTAVLLVALSAACATSLTNWRQVLLYSEAEMVRQGEGAYRQMQSELPMSSDPREITYVQCVADHVIAASNRHSKPLIVGKSQFDSPQANAFALPGGKIGIIRGYLTWLEPGLLPLSWRTK